MQLIILLLLHTRRIPEKNKSKRKTSTYFQVYKYTENALVYFSHTSAGFQRLMHTLTCRILWWFRRQRRRTGCLPRWGLCGCSPGTTFKKRKSLTSFFSRHPTCYIPLPRSWSHRCKLAPEASDWVSPPGRFEFTSQWWIFLRLRSQEGSFLC